MTRILVTGGGGFLGRHLVERLRADGHDVVISRRRDYDLTRWEDAERLFDETRPRMVFHLAAEVGGIGANRANAADLGGEVEDPPRARLVEEPLRVLPAR